MKYYQDGNLYTYLENGAKTIKWKDITIILRSLSLGLKLIHKFGLVHGNLHGGNILIENEMDSIDAKIADTGLHGPVDEQILSSKNLWRSTIRYSRDLSCKYANQRI